MELCIPLKFLTHISGCLPRQPLRLPSVYSPTLLERGRAQGESYQVQGHPQANREWLPTTGCISHTRTQSLGPTPSPESSLSGSLSVASHPESPLCSVNSSGLLKRVLAFHTGLALPHRACLLGLAVRDQVRSHSRPCLSGSFCVFYGPKVLCPTFAGQRMACPGFPPSSSHMSRDSDQASTTRGPLPVLFPVLGSTCMVSSNSVLRRWATKVP